MIYLVYDCLGLSLLLQVKKLVYVYLVRYAEEQQDLALLSISTFQRGLKVSLAELNNLKNGLYVEYYVTDHILNKMASR